jgi:LuxR family maltose regulon positive regulatory protein
VLILDDYQHCDTPLINRILSFLIERLPPTVHLVLAARSEPQLRLARWRAQRRLLELRTADLRFSVAEAAALLAELTGRALDPAAVALLEQRTEGWAVGLQLAGLALRDRPARPAPVDAATLGERYSLDFLASEVLDQLPDRLRSFLLSTSILDRMCADLCAVVLGPLDPTGAAEQPILEELERRGLFVASLDSQRTWFRYHPLFAQLLRERLVRSTDAATLAALHRRAGAWLAAPAAPGAAIGHWLAASDADAAVTLIEAHALPLLFRGQGQTVRAWLASLPPDPAQTRPALALISAWTALFTSEITAAQQYCAAAAAALERDPAALPERHAGLAALQSVLTSFVERYAAAIDAGRFAVAQLPAGSPLHSMVRAGLAFAALLDGRLDDAEVLAHAELAALPADPAVTLLRIHKKTPTLSFVRQRHGAGTVRLSAAGEAPGKAVYCGKLRFMLHLCYWLLRQASCSYGSRTLTIGSVAGCRAEVLRGVKQDRCPRIVHFVPSGTRLGSSLQALTWSVAACVA